MFRQTYIILRRNSSETATTWKRDTLMRAYSTGKIEQQSASWTLKLQCHCDLHSKYRDADKSLARPVRKHATATKI